MTGDTLPVLIGRSMTTAEMTRAFDAWQAGDDPPAGTEHLGDLLVTAYRRGLATGIRLATALEPDHRAMVDAASTIREEGR